MHDMFQEKMQNLSLNRDKIVFKVMGDEHPDIGVESELEGADSLTRASDRAISVATAVAKSVGEAQSFGNELRDANQFAKQGTIPVYE